MLILLVMTAALATGNSIPESFSIYRLCVERFAFEQIRSNESAETLVAAGVANCRKEFELFEGTVREMNEERISKYPEARSLPHDVVRDVIDEETAEFVSEFKAKAEDSVLRNVVFFRARLNEIENR